jgi:hypothetical protein
LNGCGNGAEPAALPFAHASKAERVLSEVTDLGQLQQHFEDCALDNPRGNGRDNQRSYCILALFRDRDTGRWFEYEASYIKLPLDFFEPGLGCSRKFLDFASRGKGLRRATIL